MIMLMALHSVIVADGCEQHAVAPSVLERVSAPEPRTGRWARSVCLGSGVDLTRLSSSSPAGQQQLGSNAGAGGA